MWYNGVVGNILSMITIKEQEQLAQKTTFEIGGTARYFAEVTQHDELREAILFAREKNVPFFLLGGGSNVLFADTGFDGLVIHMVHNTLHIHDDVLITCGAGTKLMDVIVYAAQNNLGGVEGLAGIPGSVGGAVRGNAGAFGMEMRGIVERVAVYDTETGGVTDVAADACGFAYRMSAFKKDPTKIILDATLRFTRGEKNTITRAIYDTVEKRNAKHIQDIKSAGSWFINPTVNARVQELFTKETGQTSHEGRVPAGWLLQSTGMFQKRIGDIQAGIQHANYFINMGSGTAEQALQLSSMAKTRVRDEFDVQLKEEVVLAGF